MSTQVSNPRKSKPKSHLDLIEECDNFPYHHIQKEEYQKHISQYYSLKVAGRPDTNLGWVLPSTVDAFRGLPHWDINNEHQALTLTTGDTEAERSRAVAITAETLRKRNCFDVLKGWRNELYPVYGPGRELLFSIERSASPLLGVLTYGCHMTAYTCLPQGLSIWVPRRAATKQTYGGMLDNTVAGGIATGERPFESMIRECGEEASLKEDFVRKGLRAAGTVTYFHIRDGRAGGESGLLQPECQFVYDLELPNDMIPKPSDDEVEGFELKSIQQVKAALRDGEFKPNCALVLLDFFIRHGILTAEDEGYIEIVSRIHRILEFPTL